MKKIAGYFDQNFEKHITIVLFSAMICLCLLQVFFRFVINASLAWTEELSRYCFIASIYSAASYGVKTDDHIRVDVLNSLLPRRAAFYLRVLADMIWFVFSVYVVCSGVGMCRIFIIRGQSTPTLHIPSGYLYAVVPVGFGLMAVRIVQKVISDIRNHFHAAKAGEAE